MPKTTRRITPVILSGGSGTRLWPLSRSERPKQLLSLVESATMLQATVGRIGDVARFAAPLVVSNVQHAEAISDQLRAIGVEGARLILEPMARNTAPAIALAALVAAADAPDMPLLVMPSDHVIGDIGSFHAAIEAALPAVATGWLVTFGIAPDAPETGYGYIRRGEPLLPGVERAEAFIEKPDRAAAADYLASGRFAWNGGIFLFRADVYLDALARLEPELLAACRRAIERGTIDGAMILADGAAFAAAPAISVDYAVMERSDQVAVVPVDMAWSDVGSWDALYALSARDAAGNRYEGEVIGIDTHDCFVRSDGPLVAAIGVSDLTVIASEDAVLVMRRGESQDVKRAIETLQERRHASLDRPRRLDHSWGHARTVCSGDAIDVTLIEVNPGASSVPLSNEGRARYERVAGEGRADPLGTLDDAVLEANPGSAVTLVNTGERALVVLRTVTRR